MVLATSQRGRSTRDERHAGQIALLVAIAAHLFLGVWMLQRAVAPSVTSPPGLILVDLSSAPAIAAKAKVVATRTKDGRGGNIPGAIRNTDRARLASEPRAAVVAGNISVGAISSSGSGQDAAANISVRGSERPAGMHGRFVPPKVLRQAPGEYPERAFHDGAEGRVQVLVTIGSDGGLVDARIASSSGNAALDEASLETVRHYLFKAGLRDDAAAEMDAYIDIGWTITPAVVRHYAGGESVLALPPGLTTKRAPTRIGSWMKTMKTDAIEAGQ